MDKRPVEGIINMGHNNKEEKVVPATAAKQRPHADNIKKKELVEAISAMYKRLEINKIRYLTKQAIEN